MFNSLAEVSSTFTAWGQYIIHDIIQTPDAISFSRTSETAGSFGLFKCTCSNGKNFKTSVHERYHENCHEILIDQDLERQFRNNQTLLSSKEEQSKDDELDCIIVKRSQPHSGSSTREQKTVS